MFIAVLAQEQSLSLKSSARFASASAQLGVRLVAIRGGIGVPGSHRSVGTATRDATSLSLPGGRTATLVRAAHLLRSIGDHNRPLKLDYHQVSVRIAGSHCDVAMIHADGDAVGKALLSGEVGVTDLGAFSLRLREATEAAKSRETRHRSPLVDEAEGDRHFVPSLRQSQEPDSEQDALQHS